MVLNSPGVKKTWNGILVLLSLSSVTWGRSLDLCPNTKQMYSIYFIPDMVAGTSCVLALVIFLKLLGNKYYYSLHS